VDVRVPHPRHDTFLADPTHVRPILPTTLEMFSRAFIADSEQRNVSTTPLAYYHGTDMKLRSANYLLAEHWRQAVLKGELSEREAQAAIDQFNNVCTEIVMVWEKVS
jgi:hypothetical protein